jgi:hypothetical protein
VREALNRRLADGKPAAFILAWINRLPEVKAVLKKQFKGEPINEYNISRWRYSGYAGWLERQQTRDAIEAMAASCAGFDDGTREALAERITLVLTARLVAELRRFDAMAEGDVKNRAAKELVWRLAQLRRGEFYAGKLRLERERLRLSPAAKAEEARKKRRRRTPAQKQREIRRVLGTE